MYQKSKKFFITSVLFLVFMGTITTCGWAYRQNGFINLGSTGSMDAVLPPPGFYGSFYNSYYSADRFNDDSGEKLAGMDHELDVSGWVTQLIYFSEKKIFGLQPGYQVCAGFLGMDLDSPIITSGKSGLTDLCVGALAGSNFKPTENSTLFWFFEVDTYIPTGRYDKDEGVNVGSNFYTVEPFVSLTWLLPHGFEITSRLIYTINMENKDTDERGGNAFHMNYVVTKTVFSDNLRLGVHGYYLQQLEEDEIDGVSLDNSEEKVFAIGPTIVLNNKGTYYSLSAMFESGAENKSEGNRIVFRIIQKFL